LTARSACEDGLLIDDGVWIAIGDIMKMAILCILALAAFAPPAFAQTWCEQSCCEESGGSWDSDFESCGSPGDSYYSCMSDYCSTSASGAGTTGGSGSPSCCGSIIFLGTLSGAAFIAGNRKVAR
jgi:hypothetical protein